MDTQNFRSQTLLTNQEWAGLITTTLIVKQNPTDSSAIQQIDISSIIWNKEVCERIFQNLQKIDENVLESVTGDILLPYSKSLTHGAIAYTARDISKYLPENHPAEKIRACFTHLLHKRPVVYEVLDYAHHLNHRPSHTDDWATILAAMTMDADSRNTKAVHENQLDILADSSKFVPFAKALREEMKYPHFKRALEMKKHASEILKGKTLKVPAKSPSLTLTHNDPSKNNIIH